ncbi:MAG: hypothetical protein HQK65_20135 [Desulfamplus sp.]|nr:hypothetical protein [Desulfamplus sp.]
MQILLLLLASFFLADAVFAHGITSGAKGYIAENSGIHAIPFMVSMVGSWRNRTKETVTVTQATYGEYSKLVRVN